MTSFSKNLCLKRPIVGLILLAFLIETVFPWNLRAQTIPSNTPSLPPVGSMVGVSEIHHPAVLKGLKIFPENPLRFDFLIDTGESKLEDEAFSQEANKLIRYFLATLTTPQEDLWVNLSPNEPDRIIPTEFGITEMGRDMLAQDYLLKQITASLMYPEKDLGKKFWDRIYKQAQEKLGTTQVPVNTFSKVWIVPDEATVYVKDGIAFILKSHLKVMTEQDYLTQRQSKTPSSLEKSNNREMMSQIVREVIIPEIEKEVNEGKNFTLLRQIFHSMILAVWYKQNLKESLLNKVYTDQNKVAGVDADDPEVKEKIYQQYLEAFKKGVYNYIKEEVDPATQQMIPRKYFSGGVWGSALRPRQVTQATPAEVDAATTGVVRQASVALEYTREKHDEEKNEPVREAIRDENAGFIRDLRAAGYTVEEIDGEFQIRGLVEARGQRIGDEVKITDEVDGRRFELTLRKNGRLIIVHPAFKGQEHVGRGRRVVYAADAEGVKHEEAEAEAWENWAVTHSEGPRMTPAQIVAGEMGERLRAWANGQAGSEGQWTEYLTSDPVEIVRRQNLLISADHKFHIAGLRAENTNESRTEATRLEGQGPRTLKEARKNFDIAIARDGAANMVSDGVPRVNIPTDPKYHTNSEQKEIAIDINHAVNRMIAPGMEDFEQFHDIYNEVDGVVRKLLETQVLNPNEYRFYLEDTISPNAYVLRNYNVIVVSLGLLKMFADKGQLSQDALAFVLGHEITHIQQGRDDIDHGHEHKGIIDSHLGDRAREYHADLGGLRLMDQAGFNVKEAPKLFQILAEWMQARKMKDSVWGSHPEVEERFRQLSKLVTDYHWNSYLNEVQPFSPEAQAQAVQRTRYRDFQERVVHAKTADEVRTLIQEATRIEEAQFAFLYGSEALPGAEKARLAEIKEAFDRKMFELAGDDRAKQVLYRYFKQELASMVERREMFVEVIQWCQGLLRNEDSTVLIQIMELGVPRIFGLALNVDPLSLDESHQWAEHVYTYLTSSAVISMDPSRQLPKGRVQRYLDGFFYVATGILSTRIRDGQLNFEQTQRLLQAMVYLEKEIHTRKLAADERNIQGNIARVISQILTSESFARQVSPEQVRQYLKIHESFGNGYAVGGYDPRGAVASWRKFMQNASPETRAAVREWAINTTGEISELREEFLKEDIKQFLQPPPSFADALDAFGGRPQQQEIKGTVLDFAIPAEYLQALLSNDSLVKKWPEIFKTFLKQLPRDLPADQLVSFHKNILGRFRELKATEDADIFFELGLQARDQKAFQNDAFDEALQQAIDPSMLPLLNGLNPQIKALFYVFVLGGVPNSESTRSFIFGEAKKRTRPGSILEDPEIISLIKAATPQEPVDDPEDIGDRFNALSRDDRQHIRARWNEINPEIHTPYVKLEDFEIIFKFLETIRPRLGARLAKDHANAEESEIAFGQYVAPIYLQRFFASIGYTSRLNEDDTKTISSSTWKAFEGEIASSGLFREGERVTHAFDQRPVRDTRLNGKDFSLAKFLNLFQFIPHLSTDYDRAIAQVAESLPPTVVRNFILYQIFVARVLQRDLDLTLEPTEIFDLSIIQERLRSLDPGQITQALDALAKIFPFIIEDELITEVNRKIIGAYLTGRKVGPVQLDNAIVRVQHATEVAGYEEALYAPLGGNLAQLHVFLGRLTDERLQTVVGSVTTSLQEKRTIIMRFYPQRSPVRDRWLKLAVESNFTQTSTEEFEQTLPLFTNPSIRENLALRALDQHRDHAPELFQNLDSALTQIQRLFPDASPLRDDILQETAQFLATTTEEYRKIEALFVDPFEKGAQMYQKEEARIIFGRDHFRSYIKNRTPQEKTEALLWLLGISDDKPFFLMHFEYSFHVTVDSYREIFLGSASRYYSQAGRSAQQEFLEPFLYGEKGVFSDAAATSQFLDQLFGAIVPASHQQTLYKKVYDAAFAKANPLRREKILLSLIWSLNQYRQEADEGKVDEERKEAMAVRYFLESLGLAGKKLAQVLSRSSSVKKVMREELAKVQDKAQRLPKGIVFDLMEKLYGNFEDKFEAIEQPLGSASIKVVYKARLKGGRVVVAKIKRPEIEKEVEEDLSFLREILEDVRPTLTAEGVIIPKNLLRQIEQTIREELNFESEASNTRQLRENVMNRSLTKRAMARLLSRSLRKVVSPSSRTYRFAVPEVLETVNNALILEEAVEGVGLTNETAVSELGLDRVDLEHATARELLIEVLVDGFYHGDPHRGNVMVSSDGTLHLIDAGVTFQISLSNRIRLVRLFKAIGNNSPQGLRKIVEGLGGSVTPTIEAGFTEHIFESHESLATKTLWFFQILEDANIDIPEEFLNVFRFLGTGGALFEDPIVISKTPGQSSETGDFQAFEVLRVSGAQTVDASLELARRADTRRPIPGVDVKNQANEPVFDMVPAELQEIAANLRISPEEVGGLVNRAFRALEESGLDSRRILQKKILLALLNKDAFGHPFGDHEENSLIILTRILFDLAKFNPEVARILFIVGVAHELRHEAGETDEFSGLDITLFRNLMDEYSIPESAVIRAFAGVENLDSTEFVMELLGEYTRERHDEIRNQPIERGIKKVVADLRAVGFKVREKSRPDGKKEYLLRELLLSQEALPEKKRHPQYNNFSIRLKGLTLSSAANGKLTIAHPAFRGYEHVGRGRRTIYVADDAGLRHETTEMDKWETWVVTSHTWSELGINWQGPIMKINQIEAREMGERLRAWANGWGNQWPEYATNDEKEILRRQNLLIKMDHEFHLAGLRAEVFLLRSEEFPNERRITIIESKIATLVSQGPKKFTKPRIDFDIMIARDEIISENERAEKIKDTTTSIIKNGLLSLARSRELGIETQRGADKESLPDQDKGILTIVEEIESPEKYRPQADQEYPQYLHQQTLALLRGAPARCPVEILAERDFPDFREEVEYYGEEVVNERLKSGMMILLAMDQNFDQLVDMSIARDHSHSLGFSELSPELIEAIFVPEEIFDTVLEAVPPILKGKIVKVIGNVRPQNNKDHPVDVAHNYEVTIPNWYQALYDHLLSTRKDRTFLLHGVRLPTENEISESLDPSSEDPLASIFDGNVPQVPIEYRRRISRLRTLEMFRRQPIWSPLGETAIQKEAKEEQARRAFAEATTDLERERQKFIDEFLQRGHFDNEDHAAEILESLIDQTKGAIPGDRKTRAEEKKNLVEMLRTTLRAKGAATEAPGGIDFNPAKMKLKTEGEQIDYQFPFDPQSLGTVPFDGLTPVILKITPVPNVPQFLGLNQETSKTAVAGQKS
ncbi:MAG: AarF/UbiB family protein [Candidatus Omnitrophica bacterium]|nr:AarF/UbiB family protein [Candidatus Omnitrophota bacterium]